MEQMKPKNQKILLLIIGALILLFVISTGWFLNQKNISQVGQKTVTATSGDVLLSFTPNILPIKNGGTVDSGITYDAGLNETTKLKIVVTYDPKMITNVKLTPYKDPTSALSYSLEQNVQESSADPKTGTATLTLALVNGATAQKGHGIIAKLTAKVISSPTTLSLSPESGANNASAALTLGRINLDIVK